MKYIKRSFKQKKLDNYLNRKKIIEMSPLLNTYSKPHSKQFKKTKKRIYKIKFTSEIILDLNDIIQKKDVCCTNKFIQKITREECIFMLHKLNMISETSLAPTPLLKNILYNCITSNIKSAN